MNLSRDWDVICVGAGITSLAFAAELVRRHPGVRVLVLDKHSLPGGYATWFRRPKVGARFDCSLHKLSGMAAGGNLQRILHGLGADAVLDFVYPHDYFHQVLPGRTVALDGDVEVARRQLVEAFPDERLGIETFFDDVASHGKDGYYQFQMTTGDYQPDFQRLRQAYRTLRKVTVDEKFAALFRDDDLKDILCAPGIYIGAFPEQISYLYYLHVIYATLTCRCAYVVGSAQRLSNHLVELVRQAGGEVLLSCPGRRILVDGDGAAVGVETRRGPFYAPRIYINAAPKYALEALFPDVDGLEPVRRKLAGLRNSNSATTLYVLTDAPPHRLGVTAIEAMVRGGGHDGARRLRRAAAAGDAVDEEAYWQAGTLEVTNYHALDPVGGNVLVANVLDVIQHWPERRSSEYKAKKNRAKAILLRRLTDAFPGLAGHIQYLEVSTPKTYQRFTNNTDGAGFGALVGTDLSSWTFHYDFPIRGVRFLSSWVAGPGYEAAFGYAEMQAAQWRPEIAAGRSGVAAARANA